MIKINFVVVLKLGGQDFYCVKIIERIKLGRGLKLTLYPCLDLLEYSSTLFTINWASKRLADHLFFYATSSFPMTQAILEPMSTIYLI